MRETPEPKGVVKAPRKTIVRPDDTKVYLRCMVPLRIRQALRHMAVDLGVPTGILIEQVLVAFVKQKAEEHKT